eukprot:3698960-Amphidinium_carterae.1
MLACLSHNTVVVSIQGMSPRSEEAPDEKSTADELSGLRFPTRPLRQTVDQSIASIVTLNVLTDPSERLCAQQEGCPCAPLPPKRGGSSVLLERGGHRSCLQNLHSLLVVATAAIAT